MKTPYIMNSLMILTLFSGLVPGTSIQQNQKSDLEGFRFKIQQDREKFFRELEEITMLESEIKAHYRVGDTSAAVDNQNFQEEQFSDQDNVQDTEQPNEKVVMLEGSASQDKQEKKAAKEEVEQTGHDEEYITKQLTVPTICENEENASEELQNGGGGGEDVGAAPATTLSVVEETDEEMEMPMGKLQGQFNEEGEYMEDIPDSIPTSKMIFHSPKYDISERLQPSPQDLISDGYLSEIPNPNEQIRSIMDEGRPKDFVADGNFGKEEGITYDIVHSAYTQVPAAPRLDGAQLIDEKEKTFDSEELKSVVEEIFSKEGFEAFENRRSAKECLQPVTASSESKKQPCGMGLLNIRFKTAKTPFKRASKCIDSLSSHFIDTALSTSTWTFIATKELRDCLAMTPGERSALVVFTGCITLAMCNYRSLFMPPSILEHCTRDVFSGSPSDPHNVGNSVLPSNWVGLLAFGGLASAIGITSQFLLLRDSTRLPRMVLMMSLAVPLLLTYDLPIIPFRSRKVAWKTLPFSRLALGVLQAALAVGCPFFLCWRPGLEQAKLVSETVRCCAFALGMAGIVNSNIIINDLHALQQDRVQGKLTVPVVFGIPAAKILVIFLAMQSLFLFIVSDVSIFQCLFPFLSMLVMLNAQNVPENSSYFQKQIIKVQGLVTLVLWTAIQTYFKLPLGLGLQLHNLAKPLQSKNRFHKHEIIQEKKEAGWNIKLHFT